MHVSLKIYSLESGYSRLAMLADYISTKNSHQFIHILIAAAGTLNSKYINAKNTIYIEKDILLNERLKQALQLLKAKFHYEQVLVHCQQNMLLTVMQQIIQGLPKVLANSTVLNIYDGDCHDVEMRHQLLTLPEGTLASLLNIEELQLNSWLQNPEIPFINLRKKISHLIWQRLFTTNYFWLDTSLSQNASSLTHELNPCIQPLPLPANKNISQTNKLALCKLLNIPNKTLNKLVNSTHSLLWIMDSNKTLWFNPLHDLRIYRDNIQHEGQIIYQTCASNINNIPLDEDIQLLPWWISPEIATFFPQAEITRAGDAVIWERLGMEATSQLTTVSRGDYWVLNMEASMGDLLYLLSTLPAFRAKHAGEIVIILSKIYHSIALRSPFVDAVWDIDNPAEHYDELKVAISKQRVINIMDWHTVLAPEHMQSAMCRKLSIDYREAEQQLILRKTTDEQQRVEKFIQHHRISGAKTVLLHPALGAPNRTWPQQHWKDLCNRFLADGWRMVLIGSNHNKYKDKTMSHWSDPRIVDAIDEFSPIESTILMDHCDLLVSCDAGPIALAAASNIATCALYSNIPGHYRLPTRRGRMGWNASAINRGCQFGQCGETFIDSALRIATCPEEQEDLSGLAFSKWCPNENKYACLHDYTAAQFWQAIQDFLRSEHYIPFADRQTL